MKQPKAQVHEDFDDDYEDYGDIAPPPVARRPTERKSKATSDSRTLALCIAKAIGGFLLILGTLSAALKGPGAPSGSEAHRMGYYVGHYTALLMMLVIGVALIRSGYRSYTSPSKRRKDVRRRVSPIVWVAAALVMALVGLAYLGKRSSSGPTSAETSGNALQGLQSSRALPSTEGMPEWRAESGLIESLGPAVQIGAFTFQPPSGHERERVNKPGLVGTMHVWTSPPTQSGLRNVLAVHELRSIPGNTDLTTWVKNFHRGAQSRMPLSNVTTEEPMLGQVSGLPGARIRSHGILNGNTVSFFVYGIQASTGCVGVNGIVMGPPDGQQYKMYEASALTCTTEPLSTISEPHGSRSDSDGGFTDPRSLAQNSSPPHLPDRFVYRPSFRTAEAEFAAGTAFAVDVPGYDRPVVLTAIHLFGPSGGLQRGIPAKELPDFVNQVELVDVWNSRQLIGTATTVLSIPQAGPLGEPSVAGDVAAFVVDDGVQLDAATLASASPQPGDVAWLAAEVLNARPRGKRLHRATVIGINREGLLQYEFEQRDLRLQATSGAPLLNSAGEVVGINLGGGTHSGRTYGIANPVEKFAQFLK